MSTYKNKVLSVLFLLMLFFISCQKLEDMNINPNGVDPANAKPYLLLTSVLTFTGQSMTGLGFGDIAGVMQHTQKDGWSGSHNSYDWSDQNWSGYYGILRNADEMLRKSQELGLEFYEGVALIMKAYNFGLIADLWGDAPFTEALKGESGNLQPAYDSQRNIYVGILDWLETANTLLSKSQGEYDEINTTQDVVYEGSVARWQKFANSLALRYYMRISVREEAIAKAGIEKILADPVKYPIIKDAADDASISYIGNSSSDSWPCNSVYDVNETSWRRLKMCSTLVEKLQSLSDPRLGLWANRIEIPIVIDPGRPDNFDQIIAGTRIIAQNVADNYQATFGFPVDTDPEYVGLPPAWSMLPQAYNLNPNLEQAPINPHASHLNNMYKLASGPHLKSRLISAAEINFILAEAALKGWSVGGTAETYYKEGVKASFIAWNLGNKYEDYIDNAGVVYTGTLAQIMEQKWIAGWTAATESWFDYRRTGYPALQPGTVVLRNAIPIRFLYGTNELLYNTDRVEEAINLLEETTYSSTDGKNSPWSRTWLMQGTGKPW